MARTGIPPVTRLYLICLAVCSLLTFVLRYSAYLHLVSAEVHDEDHEHLITNVEGTDQPDPSYKSDVPHPQDIYVPLIALVTGHTSLLLKPWTLFTSAFIEDGFISFATSFGLILYTGRYIEVLWGSREFFYYLTANVLASNFVAYLVYGLKTLTSEEETVQITGTSAIIIALLMAIKQRIPNHYLLFLNGFIRLKVSLVPFLILTTTTVLSFMVPGYKISCILNWSGFITSWVFLRFFKDGGSGRQLAILPVSTDSSTSLQLASRRGDRTSQFALSTFFPYPISVLVELITDKVFTMAHYFKILDKNTFTNDDSELDTSPQEILLMSTPNVTQSDLVSTMSQSRIFTSSSLAGVSGNVSPFSFPRGSLLQKLSDRVIAGFGGQSRREVDANLDRRRKLVLMQLDSKLGDQS